MFRLGFSYLFIASAPFFLSPAHAEVRFGNNVFIGGHNVSNQTFNSQRRGEFYVHEGSPAHPGCTWRANGDGSRTKVCHFQRKR